MNENEYFMILHFKGFFTSSGELFRKEASQFCEQQKIREMETDVSSSQDFTQQLGLWVD